MRKKIVLLTLVFTTLFIVSCVQVPVESMSRASQLAISSVRDIPVSYTKNSLFSLSPKYVEETSLKAEQTQIIYQLYTDAITTDLVKNGFQSTNIAKQADFHVGFGIALSQDLSDDSINEKFGVSPGLAEQKDLKKGSFLIYIEDTRTGKRVWRGIAQGFAHEQLSPEERKQRISTVISAVMKQFYQTN